VLELFIETDVRQTGDYQNVESHTEINLIFVDRSQRIYFCFLRWRRFDQFPRHTLGRVFSVSQDKTAKCFDFAVDCEIMSVNFPSALASCTLLHSESILYCGWSDGDIYQAQLAQDSGLLRPFQGQSIEILDLLVSDDDRSLYSCSLDGSVRRWDTSTGQTIQQIQVKGVPFGIRFLPAIEAPRREGAKGKRSKKDAIAAKQEMKKGFPTLPRTVSGNRDDMVGASVEDVDVLSLEGELAIAVADVCAQQPMKCEASVADVEASVTDKRDSEIEELRRQKGAMLQLLLARGYKE
jgi:hypothetical protein